MVALFRVIMVRYIYKQHRGGQDMSEQEQTVEQPKFRHIQVKLTPEEFKEVNLWLLQNDISDKGDFVKQILLRKVRNYEPVQSNERLPASETSNGYDTFR